MATTVGRWVQQTWRYIQAPYWWFAAERAAAEALHHAKFADYWKTKRCFNTALFKQAEADQAMTRAERYAERASAHAPGED